MDTAMVEISEKEFSKFTKIFDVTDKSGTI